MLFDPAALRLEGVYLQKNGLFMQRIKLAAGLISTDQAHKVALIAEKYADGTVHLTTRGSMELHGIVETDIPLISHHLSKVGLVTRGACGGAVRGVSCCTSDLPGYPIVQTIARKLQNHFTQNPHFEGLPKKFKISIEIGYAQSKHLIQDVGVVLTSSEDEQARFDVFIGGGLGKNPRPAFLMDSGLSETELIPLIEKIIIFYKQHSPKGKRLKHLVEELGQSGLCCALKSMTDKPKEAHILDAFPKALPYSETHSTRIKLEIGIFAGQLDTKTLKSIAEISEDHGEGFMVITSDQNVVLFASDADHAAIASKRLSDIGLTGLSPEQKVLFRICPGSHECKMGLAPTREIALQLIYAMGTSAHHKTWAISGCHNSCSQPQLADFGIIADSLRKMPDSSTQPVFTFLKRTQISGFAQIDAEGLSINALIHKVKAIQ